jgi:hypothetical protein
MNFTEYLNEWVQAEVLQGKIMVGVGLILIPVLWAILKGEHQLLKGALIPLALLLVVLIGYGGYILYSRPAHGAQSTQQFELDREQALKLEKAKHINDNKAGNTLLKIYPILMLISILPLLFAVPVYYKGMGLGFTFLFMAIFIIDYGFVSRSNAFMAYIDTLM